MTTIRLFADDQKLRVAHDGPCVVSGSRNATMLHVQFGRGWSDYEKSAVFYTTRDDKVYEVLLDEGKCTIPHEVLSLTADLYIGVRGVSSEHQKVKPTSLVKYKIEKGAPVGDGATVEPTPDVYQQILMRLNDLEVGAGGEVDPVRVTQIVEQYLEKHPAEPGKDGLPGRDGVDGAPGRDGVDGKDGEDGKSAYQYAQDGGYTGSEEEFSQKLAADSTGGASGGDKWTKLGDVTVQDTYEFVPLSFTEGIVTVDTATEAYSWISQYDKVHCVVHPIDITSKAIRPVVGMLRKLDAEPGTFEFYNRDNVFQSTAAYDPTIYKISVENVASVEMTDVPPYDLYKLRMTTPVLAGHGMRMFYSSTMNCLSMDACVSITASGGGIFEVETMRYPIDSNYMYKRSNVSYSVWYGGSPSSDLVAFELVRAGIGKTQPPTAGKIRFEKSSMIFVNGTRFELWGANDDQNR